MIPALPNNAGGGVASHNFCRIRGSMGVTPAMEAGITDHVWELEEIVGLL